ncbi:hypothetical protein [Flavobacterium faecale]|uniref:hypothetical protein n=1 Tax=Flavobacterium faecale TaxID=1355330 RepID=UPI003AAD1CF9
MKSNALEEYKIAIKAKYEVEKLGKYSSFLLNPSRAKLRNLCFEVLKNDSNKDDLMSFASFCGFEFTPVSSNKLKGITDKFRPIETFFKGETDLADLEAVNIAAILVDYKWRPFLKYSKANNVLNEISNGIESTKEEGNDVGSTILVQSNQGIGIKQPKGKRIFYKQITFAVLVTSVFCGVGLFLLPKKECMQWQMDHYEVVDCQENTSLGILNRVSKVPLNNELLFLRKIEVCDTTTFFKDHRAMVWYCKNGKDLEFFNNSGFHPENDKPLKPITVYMINKYVKAKKYSKTRL